jgi:shikimate kinase
MGAGKTSKGKKLAQELGFRFIDMDQALESQEGMSVQEIFSSMGEEWFRKRESEVLHQIGDTCDEVVIATGGGTPCYHGNMDYINTSGISVYLRMSPEGLAERLTRSSKPTRPLIQGKNNEELLAYITEKLKEREPYYLLAQHITDAENLIISELASFLHR